jgi:hypothetical protein
MAEVVGARSKAGVQFVDAGATVSIVGQYWTHECNDTPGCIPDRADPWRDIDLGLARARVRDEGWWEQVGEPIPLGVVDADGELKIHLDDVTLPTTPGRYVFVASGGGPYGQLVIRGA